MEREMDNGTKIEMPVLSTAPKKPRGFAAMSREQQRAIAAMGGRASHVKGTGHKWTAEEAREAGKKGYMASGGGRGKATQAAQSSK